MQFLTSALKNLYYYTTLPYRCRRSRQYCEAGQAPVGVVVFHRIADDAANGWTTDTKTFIKALDWLQDRFEMVSLDKAQRSIRGAKNTRPQMAITFDDGYAVNSEVALPLLVERKIPCTYFVSTGPVLNGSLFQHDLEMGNRFAPNTIAELRHFATAGIEIGAHTRTHADLGTITDSDLLYDELVVARNDLQDALGEPIRYFAFPFGTHRNLNAAAFTMARAAGYAGVCSAYGGYNFPGDDGFHLQRRGVDGSLIRLKNWSTMDPIRNRHVERFVYPTAEASRTGLGTT